MLLRRLRRRRAVPDPPASSAPLAARSAKGRLLSTEVSSELPSICRSIAARCPDILRREPELLPFPPRWASLQEVIRAGVDMAPEALRRYWRSPRLAPSEVLGIVVAFGPDPGVQKSTFLYGLYNWAGLQGPEFRHLPETKKAMITVLANADMLENAEKMLLSVAGCEETILSASDLSVLFSRIIEGYAECGNADRSIELYDRARGALSLVPAVSCYHALLRLLIHKKRANEALKVYTDMLEVGLGHLTEESFVDFAIKALMKIDRVVEAITVIWKLKSSGFAVPQRILSAIALEFCRKKDFGDMMHFLEEWRHVPDAHSCNKLVSSLCVTPGSESAWAFVQKMEALGFQPDGTTFAILISHSCKSRKLKDAFAYLSECFSRGIKPQVCYYNALVAGLFKEDLYRHAKYVVEDMVDQGVAPELSTYKIMLAGYCRHKKFDEVEHILDAMKHRGAPNASPQECALVRALNVLGLEHLEVKIVKKL